MSWKHPTPTASHTDCRCSPSAADRTLPDCIRIMGSILGQLSRRYCHILSTCTHQYVNANKYGNRTPFYLNPRKTLKHTHKLSFTTTHFEVIYSIPIDWQIFSIYHISIFVGVHTYLHRLQEALRNTLYTHTRTHAVYLAYCTTIAL